MLLLQASAARRVDSAAAGRESEFREVSRKTTVPPDQRKRNIQGIIANNRRLVMVGPARRVRLRSFGLRLCELFNRCAFDIGLDAIYRRRLRVVALSVSKQPAKRLINKLKSR